MDNLINVYMNFLTNNLVKVGLVCFRDEMFVEKKLERYVRTYIDNKYYGIFHTVDDDSTYSLEVLTKEFEGLTVELLEDYQDYELTVSNDEYRENVEIIKSLKDFCLDLVKVDDIKFKTDYYHDINNIFRKYNVNIKLINKIMKKFVDRNNKFLSMDNGYFSVSYGKISNVDNCKMIKLDYNISLLNNYRWVLIDKVFIDERLDINKWKISLEKFSLYLLNETLNNRKIEDKYFISLTDNVVNRKTFNKEVSTILDNPILRKYLVLVVPFDTLKDNTEAFDLGYKICINLNLEHVNDITVKLDNAVSMNKEYILVSNYKDRDYEYIKNYKTLDGKSLLLYEEVE